MTALVAVEIRRALARRVTRLLILLALIACVGMGLIVYLTTSTGPGENPPDLVDLWPKDGMEPLIAVAITFLIMGGLIGGASMTGAEWRAGTFTTLLTWEPRRGRVLTAKLIAVLVVASVVAFLLQLVFIAVLLPTMLGKGSSQGADGVWLSGLVRGILRGSLLTGVSAVAGASIAMIGKNTAAALGAAFAYFVVVENLVRGLLPRFNVWLLTTNAALYLTGGNLEEGEVRRDTVSAGLTLSVYVGLLVLLAAVTFRRRDVAAS